jgi:hypothetical protein
MANNKDFIVKNGIQVLGRDSLQTTNTTTGALVVQGGRCVGGNIAIGGGLYANGSLGTNGQVLTSNGSGISWTNLNSDITGTSNTFYISNTTASTSTTTGALTVAGGAGIGGDMYVGGNVKITGSVTVLSQIIHDETGVSVDTVPVVIDGFDITQYRSAKYFISISNATTNKFQTSEILLIQDGVSASIEQTSVFSNGDNIMTFSATVTGTNVLLKGQGTSANNVVKVQTTYITV